jgi:hypothetical protein
MTDDELKRLLNANAERFDKRFDERQPVDDNTAELRRRAMIKFSHAELDRRVRVLEQTQTTLEKKFANLRDRVERLEETKTTH